MQLVRQSAWYAISSVVASAVAVAVLPIATKVIGPEEYGQYAIATTISGIATSLGAAAIGFLLPEHYPVEDEFTKKEIVGAALLQACGAALLVSLILSLCVVAARKFLHVGDTVLLTGTMICLLGSVLGAPWIVWSELCMMTHRGKTFALATIAQAVTNACVVIVLVRFETALAYALFLGFLAGNVVICVLSAIACGDTWRMPSDRSWFAVMRGKSGAPARAALIDSGRAVIERTYLGAAVSTAAVGLLSHAQLYRNWVMLVVNAVSRAVWPINLKEASGAPPHAFELTRRTWLIVQVVVGIAVIGFICVGREVIDLLTSGKFGAAYGYANVLLLSLLVSTMAKPHFALNLVSGRGEHNANAASFGTLAALGSLFALVPLFGAMGAALSILVQAIVTRVIIAIYAARIEWLGFVDAAALSMMVLAGAVYGVVAYFDFGLLARLVVLALVTLLLLIINMKAIRTFFDVRFT
jgi:O-antigen/teichoic acid export membrane protein